MTEWKTTSLQFPDFLEGTRDSVNDFATLLLESLQIANTALDLAKNFILSYTNPLLAIAQAFKAEIEALIEDISKIGLYLTGDWKLEPNDLVGGFQGYEQRMLSRLLDSEDPTRPDVTNRTRVFAAFFYFNVDISEIGRLYSSIQSLISLFHLKINPPQYLPKPNIVDLKYGRAGQSFFTNFEQSLGRGVPPVYRIYYEAKPPVPPLNILPPPPPAGFIITVSTVKEGIPILYNNKPTRDFKGDPFLLYGGYDIIGDGLPSMVGLLGKEEFDLSSLKSGDEYLLQRVFYKSEDVFAEWFTERFVSELRYEDMPHRAEVVDGVLVDRGRATTFYIRIASCSAEVLEDFQVDVTLTEQKAGRDPVLYYTANGLSPWSEPKKVVFPSQNTRDYIQALKTALLVLALSRVDAQQSEEFEIGKVKSLTGLEQFSFILNHLFDEGSRVYDKTLSHPLEFRQSLYQKIEDLVERLYETQHQSEYLEQYVVDNTEDLRAVTWNDLLPFDLDEDMTLWDSLVSSELEEGLALSYMNMGLDEELYPEIFASSIMGSRAPDFHEKSEDLDVVVERGLEDLTDVLTSTVPGFRSVYQGSLDEEGNLVLPNEYELYLKELAKGVSYGSLDLSPVVYVDRSRIAASRHSVDAPPKIIFARNALRERPELFAQTQIALRSVASSFGKTQREGEWINKTLGNVLPEFTDYLEVINGWIESLAEGLKSATETLVAYIEFVQQRIVELQQLVERINALIQSILNFAFILPSGSMLTMLVNGTDGVVGGLVSATSKPQDSAQSYGGGVALVAPGGPSFLYELFGL